jgi:hypothetical protein
MTKRFSCRGFNSTQQESFHCAAKTFAARKARRQYGPRAVALDPVEKSCNVDRDLVEFSSFIGIRTGRNEVSGENFYFIVFLG